MPGDHLLLYDGVCGLCSRLVQFTLTRDRAAAFDFAALQSRTGRAVLSRFGKRTDDLDTVYVVCRYRSEAPLLLSRSDGVLFIMKTLGGAWRWFATLGAFCPKAIRDRLYDAVARNRYRVFSREACLVPRPEDRARFVDGDAGRVSAKT